MSTELTQREARVTLFNGAGPADVILAATEAANALADIVKQQGLYKRIGTRDHVQVEGWGVLGTLVGVYAVEAGGVRELPWPILAALGEEPEDQRTAAHTAWRQHRTLLAQRDVGRAYGYAVAYRAVKDGREVGWGEGRCNRGESKWVDRDDYALASMAQTRGQGRTLKQPLGFLVHLAGYSSTPAEEVPQDGEPAEPARVAELETELAAVKTRHLLYGALVEPGGDALAAATIQILFPDVDGDALIKICNRRFGTERLPDAAAKMLDALIWAQTPAPDASAVDNGAPPDEQPTED